MARPSVACSRGVVCMIQLVSHSVWPVPQTRVLRQCCRLPLNVFCILISLFGGCLRASSVETGDRKHTANLLHQLSVQQQQHEHLQQRAALELSLLRRHKVHRATRTTKWLHNKGELQVRYFIKVILVVNWYGNWNKTYLCVNNDELISSFIIGNNRFNICNRSQLRLSSLNRRVI